MRLASCVVLVGLVALGCSRTGLLPAKLDSDSTGQPQETPNEEPDGEEDEVPEEPLDVPPGSLPMPELSVAARLSDLDGNDSLVLVSPEVEPRGPFDVGSKSVFRYWYSRGGGRRLAYVDEQGVAIVDSWPPKPTRLEDTSWVYDIAWVDETRLVLSGGGRVELYDAEQASSQTLFESASLGADTYLPDPSPDGRWVAFGVLENGVHRIEMVDLSGEEPWHRTVDEFPVGTVTARLDWAPDSEHLAYSAAVDGRWLHAYSVSTKHTLDSPSSLTFPLESNADVPTFQWSPNGDELHFFYERFEDTEWYPRLYWVDMRLAQPGPSLLLSDFPGRYWASPGLWSPAGSALTFSAELLSPTYHEELFVVRTEGQGPPLSRTTLVATEPFVSVMKLAWAPDDSAIYYTLWDGAGYESIYKDDLEGSTTRVSGEDADVRGLFISPELGCLAYSQFAPTPALTIVNEATNESHVVGDPSPNNPHWSGSFNSSDATWVSDARGRLEGLLFKTQRVGEAATLGWVKVDDCTPGRTRILLRASKGVGLYNYLVSTEPVPEDWY